jgi:hypothetical protein
MVWAWVLAVLVLALWVVALVAFQRATSTAGRITSGIAALLLGVTGLVLVAALVFS